MTPDLAALSNSLLYGVAFLGAFLAALWLSLIIWTFRDMRARSRDVFAQVLAAAVVAVLTAPGLLVYLILRPQKTLAEAYAESLEEEALLQAIEEKRVCPGCGRQAQEAWRLCPNCLTRLKKACAECGQLMDLPWTVCPYCAAPAEDAAAEAPAAAPDEPAPAPQASSLA